ncbi:MAG: phosphoglycerate dehydrogenase [Myxococcales bacterium]|nr:phosphoglycerate dehydrogenase [Myxococcales bacterium]
MRGAMITPPIQTPLRVLLLESIHPSSHEVFRSEAITVETAATALKEEELIERLRGVQLLGIRSKTRITPRVIEAATDLIGVGAFCIGTNQIALASAERAGVPVFNAPFSNTRSVAELVISEVIALARQLFDRSREVHEGKWRKVATSCYEVRGKTLGIVGYGHIGSQVGVLAEALGMRVVSYDVRSTLPMGNNKSVDTLENLLRVADFVTLHVPETPQTQNLIGPNELALMKKGSYLLNLSRGTVVDIPALADALARKHLAGAAVDVYPEEPESNVDDFGSLLRGLSNVILTPHVGGSTEEAQEAIGREVGVALARFARHGSTVGAVNFPAVEVAPLRDGHRVLNVHRNVPGVLRDINSIVSSHDANIRAQVLATDNDVGYLVMDLDDKIAHEVNKDIAALPTSIKTRILF